MTIYLIRHGETTWNREGRYQGHLDSPLTPTGIAQLQAVGERLRQLLSNSVPVSIECSPLGRACQSAEIVCTVLGY